MGELSRGLTRGSEANSPTDTRIPDLWSAVDSLNAASVGSFGESGFTIWLGIASPDWKYSKPVENVIVERFADEFPVAQLGGYHRGAWILCTFQRAAKLDAVVDCIRQQVIKVADVLPDVEASGSAKMLPPED